MGIMNCVLPVHVLHSIFLLSQLIKPSNLYLSFRDFFFFVAEIIYF